MITAFQIGKAYIVNNPFNPDGVTNGMVSSVTGKIEWVWIPNGEIMTLMDILPDKTMNKELEDPDRFYFKFWYENKFWVCSSYVFDFIRYFDEIE